VRPAWLDQLGTVSSVARLPGGASKEAWAVDIDGEELLVRRSSETSIHQFGLTLQQEFEMLDVAYSCGIRVPQPFAYHPDLGGREGLVMARVQGETIGRRIVRNPPPGLAEEMGEELAKIHALPRARLGFLQPFDPIQAMRDELDALDEPHAALELGLVWVEDRIDRGAERVVTHGDWRIGNVVVSDSGLVAVLDWEFARLSVRTDDLAWPLVRSWRFGIDALRFGGISPVAPYSQRYAAASGRTVDEVDLLVWEVLGNIRWAVACHAQARRDLSGPDRSIEYAVLGRVAAEVEYELLDLLSRHG
jgi:aminoglycoside phosphotransferase (APT) family kinase protein